MMLTEILTYQDLTMKNVDTMQADEAGRVVAGILAERATVTGGGEILRWSEFNENPDPLINELLARMLVDKAKQHLTQISTWDSVVVLSIENSAAYVSTAIAYELAINHHLDRPPRIIRARKSNTPIDLSPAMGEQHFQVSVKPITAGGRERYLSTSVTDASDFHQVETVVIVDDFYATGSTMDGGIQLAYQLMSPRKIIPMSGLRKPEQERQTTYHGREVSEIYSGVDVTFWGDETSGKAFIQVNGFESLEMKRATIKDFHEEVS